MDTKTYFYESADVKRKFIDENETKLNLVIKEISWCLSNWSKILIAWNWWSAADSQHRAAEIVGRYKMERRSLPAIALTTDTSNITSIWNDYWFDAIFSRQIEWLGNEWDVFVWISTSWNSENIIKAIDICNMKWIKTIALLGKWWWKIKDMVDVSLIVESDNTPRIQECHQTIYHTICEELEKQLFTK